ncbi:MAG: rhodanese-like domain-containing protein [Candidatus Eisenbacteria bacterium]
MSSSVHHPLADIPLIAREELVRRLHDPSLTLVDVLPTVSWEERHIPGSRSLPVDAIESEARALLPDPAADIVVYCGGPT